LSRVYSLKPQIDRKYRILFIRIKVVSGTVRVGQKGKKKGHFLKKCPPQ
jgi:hypothetical protein